MAQAEAMASAIAGSAFHAGTSHSSAAKMPKLRTAPDPWMSR